MDSLLELWPDPDRREDALQHLLQRVLASRGASGGIDHRLTDKQRRCLFAASLGLDWRHSAAVLGVSEETVRGHLTHCRRTLAAKNTTHAVATAIRCSLIP